MCGISGIWYRDGAPVDHQLIERMTDALTHRGPDGAGAVVEPQGVALGHRRLKVIDLSDAAAQPIWLPDRSVCMVYNGEIHNYLELAAELRAAGARLRAGNDTEVLLWAYRIWGEDCFERLNGMWAAAFWEPARRQLLLSRDRFGVKPLYYSEHLSRFAFASEVKAILTAFPGERQPDTTRLRRFVRNDMADPDGGERTFFANIHSLPAGHILRVRADSTERSKYWTFRPSEIRATDAPERFRELLQDAVRIRLRSDVPFGVLLSGGLDSSAIARIAAAQDSTPLECVSLRYEAAEVDESAYCLRVADDPHRYRLHWVTPTADDLMRTVASIVWHHDAPTPMRARYPQWHVLQETARHVTVVLGGQGADEMLGGYDRFILPWLRDRLDLRLPQNRSRWALPVELIQLGQTTHGIHRILPTQLQYLMRGLMPRKPSSPGLASPGPTSAGSGFGSFERPCRSRLNNTLWHEFRYSGLPELLHAEDALSMAFSLESRLPFLDHRLVEFCFSLSFDQKVARGWTKHLLRESTAGILPEPVRLRRRKLGFPGHYAAWLGPDAGAEPVRELLLEPRTWQREWSEPARVRGPLSGSRTAANRWIRERTEQTWRLLTAELWSRQHLDNDTSLRHSPGPRVSNASATRVSDQPPARLTAAG